MRSAADRAILDVLLRGPTGAVQRDDDVFSAGIAHVAAIVHHGLDPYARSVFCVPMIFNVDYVISQRLCLMDV